MLGQQQSEQRSAYLHGIVGLLELINQAAKLLSLLLQHFIRNNSIDKRTQKTIMSEFDLLKTTRISRRVPRGGKGLGFDSRNT
jgi:hypothetical protein